MSDQILVILRLGTACVCVCVLTHCLLNFILMSPFVFAGKKESQTSSFSLRGSSLDLIFFHGPKICILV